MNYTKFDLSKFDLGSPSGHAKERTVIFSNICFMSVGVGRTVARSGKFTNSVQAEIGLRGLRKRSDAILSSSMLCDVGLFYNAIRSVRVGDSCDAAVTLNKVRRNIVSFNQETKSSILLSKQINRKNTLICSVLVFVLLNKARAKLFEINEVFDSFVDFKNFREIHTTIDIKFLPDDELIIDSEYANVLLNGVSIADKYAGDEFIYLTKDVVAVKITPLGGGTLEGIIEYNEGWL